MCACVCVCVQKKSKYIVTINEQGTNGFHNTTDGCAERHLNMYIFHIGKGVHVTEIGYMALYTCIIKSDS